MSFNLKYFEEWMKNESFYLSPKIKIIYNNNSNYGVIAAADIQNGEVLFKIPRKSILSVHNSEICDFLLRENALTRSKWGSVVLCVLHEVFLAERSRWSHYLKMFPNFDNLNLPLFWTENEKKLLIETGIEKSMEKDLDLLEKDYEDFVAPFIIKYQNLFNEGINLDTFKYYIAFVMAYSFTKTEAEDDDSEDSDYEDDTMPYMVPMADILNHTSQNNAELIYEENELIMVAIKSIKGGEEVWNTYGSLPNTQLLQQYGFTLPIEDNNDDIVELSFTDLPQSKCSYEILERLEKVSVMGHVVLCKDGLLNTNILVHALKTLHLSEDDYKIWIENVTVDESWEETDEDMEIMSDYLDELETIKKVPLAWRSLLKDLVNEALNVKKTALYNLGTFNHELPSPKLFIGRLLEGHLSILENVLRYL